MMVKNDSSLDDYTFREEVPESDLYDKSDIDDLIYVKDAHYRRKIRFLIWLAIFLIISSLLLCLFGLMYSNTIEVPEDTITQYNLFVSHSNDYYGRNVVSFKDYNSLDNALDYSFKIENRNSVDLHYKILFSNPYFGEDNIDMSLIEYKLFINDQEISSGKFTNQKDIVLVDDEISLNSVYNVNLKLWSDKISDKNKFNFKINVEG